MSNAWRLRQVVLWLALWAFAAPAGAVEVVLTPAIDTSIFSESNNAAGGSTSLFSGASNTGGTAPSGGQARRALLQFDIASMVPAGATINSASLTLRLNQVSATEPAGELRSFGLYQLSGVWGEGNAAAGTGGGGGGGGGGGSGGGAAPGIGDATWTYQANNTDPWSTPGGDFGLGVTAFRQANGIFTTNGSDSLVLAASATQSVGTALVDYTWASSGLAADVQEWLNTPASNFGWILIGPELEFHTTRQFQSSEATNAAQRPRLTINYTLAVPEPTAYIGMLLSGAAVLVGCRFVRRR